MKLFGTPIGAAILMVSVFAQTTQPSANKWSAKSKRAAEDTVASKIEMMRAAAKRPPLERVSPSERDLELVCTAAITKREIGDPFLGGLATYATSDLSAETDALKEMTVGRFYPKKKWPRYSVIVELSANSNPDHPEYTVGVARRPSAVMEFFAPLFGDVPFKGMNEWKKLVVPDCKNRKTKSER